VTIPAWVKGTLVLAVTLSAGVVMGMTYERSRAPAHEASAADSRHILQHLERSLELDSAQRTAIGAILARHQGAVDSTWHAVQPHVHAAMDSALQEIVGVLRPEQAAKYRKMVEVRHPRALP
jgi:hypothetical protein